MALPRPGPQGNPALLKNTSRQNHTRIAVRSLRVEGIPPKRKRRGTPLPVKQNLKQGFWLLDSGERATCQQSEDGADNRKSQ